MSDHFRESTELGLRLRGRTSSNGIPRVGAFVPSVYPGQSVARDGVLDVLDGADEDRRALDDLDTVCTRMGRPRPGPVLDPGGSSLWPVFFSTSGRSIPEPSHDDPSLDHASWNLPLETAGYLALTSVDERGHPSPGRGLTLVAAVLPLVLGPATAMAGPGTGGTLPVLAQPGSPPAEDAAAPTTAPATEAPSPAAPPTAAPTTQAPPTTPDAQPGIWEALEGSDVRLTMHDGTEFTGRLLGVHGTALICARAGDGLVVAVDQSQVARANALESASDVGGQRVLPPERGTGLIVGGAIMTAVAGGLIVAGIGGGAYCNNYNGYYTTYYGGGQSGDSNCVRYWVPMVVPGALLAAGGIPMIIFGKKRRDAWKKKHGFATLTPRVTRTRKGWSGGLTLRF